VHDSDTPADASLFCERLLFGLLLSCRYHQRIGCFVFAPLAFPSRLAAIAAPKFCIELFMFS